MINGRCRKARGGAREDGLETLREDSLETLREGPGR